MKDLNESREAISQIDAQIIRLFEKRMHVAADIASYKKEHGLAIKDQSREDALIEKNKAMLVDKSLEKFYVAFQKNFMAVSCDYQSSLIEGNVTCEKNDVTMNIAGEPLSYKIVTKKGALKSAGEYINLKRKVLIVTDDGVPPEYAKTIAAQCDAPFIETIPHGEMSKSPEQFFRLLQKMLDENFTRRDCVVAVGGGVVGDLSAFASSCYMRGIDFFNIPTTMLSMVDSSIGGKTAIDFGGIKNIVGSFYQPKAVIIDSETLRTLDARELHAGLAESIKMALTNDKSLFEFIEQVEKSSLLDNIEEIIEKSILIKKDVVQKDPKETGLRRVLNFGHTIGHAIESLNEPKLLHGECVALGMIPMCSENVRARLVPLLTRYNLPTKITDAPSSLVDLMKHDKKALGAKIRTVFVDEIGAFEFRDLSIEEITVEIEKAAQK